MKRRILRFTTAVSFLLMFMWTVQGDALSDGRIVAAIPFAFAVGEKTLPAGEYIFERVTPTTVLVKGVRGHAHGAATTIAVCAGREQSETKILFRRNGDQYFLAQIWQIGETTGRELPRSSLERTRERELMIRPSERQTVAVSGRLRR